MGLRASILIDGLTLDEVLALPRGDIDELVFVGEPIVVRVGTSELLGQFEVVGSTLRVELAQVEGGGEGVLLSLWLLARRFARQRRLEAVEWVVHAVACRVPNRKLQRVLERRGFQVVDQAGVGLVYFLRDDIETA